jgi:hypothetical protein
MTSSARPRTRSDWWDHLSAQTALVRSANHPPHGAGGHLPQADQRLGHEVVKHEAELVGLAGGIRGDAAELLHDRTPRVAELVPAQRRVGGLDRGVHQAESREEGLPAAERALPGHGGGGVCEIS